MNTGRFFNHAQNVADFSPYTIPAMPNCDGFMPVIGDRLRPTYRSGDIMFFKRLNDKQNIQWGELHVVKFRWPNGESHVMHGYVVQSETAGDVILLDETRSFNVGVPIALDWITDIAHVKAFLRIGQ